MYYDYVEGVVAELPTILQIASMAKKGFQLQEFGVNQNLLHY